MALTNHLITANKAVTMISNYLGNQYSRLQSGISDPSFHETKAVWFPIEDLKAYIKLLEGEKHVDGIRAYFSAYGESESKLGYTKRQSIVLVPTISGDSTSQSNYYQHRDAYKNKRGDLEPIDLEKPGTIDENEQMLMFNEVQSWPPPPPRN